MMRVFDSLYKGSAVLCATAVLSFVVPSFSYAQSNDVFNRLERLEREIDTLNRALYKGVKPPIDTSAAVVSPDGAGSSYRADLEVRLSSLEEQIRALTGKVEEHGYAIDKATRDMGRRFSDLEMRMSDLERGTGQTRGQNFSMSSTQVYNPAPGTYQENVSPSIPVAPSVPIQPMSQGDSQISGSDVPSTQMLGSMGNTEKSGSTGMYETAFSLLRSGNYDAAQTEFDKFLKTYPNHPLVENAQYWLGETHYVRNQYDQAARVFAQGYQQFPKGKKAADNLLKLGMSLAGMGNTSDACVALRQLKKDHAAAGATPVVRRAEQEMSRLQCQ